MLLFNGEIIVTPDSLKDYRNLSQYKADDNKIHEQERDIYKLWENQAIERIMFGIENQTDIDKDMPFRVIGYDGASYRSQLLKRKVENKAGITSLEKTKERYPVVTLVLYYGEKEWTSPNELKECFIPKLPNNNVSNIISKYISNYEVNIFDIGAITSKDLDKFTSDFKLVAEYFVNMRNNVTDYIPSSKGIVHVDKFLKLMSVLTGDSRYEEYIHLYTDEEKRGGKVNMCRILDARESKGRKEGRKEGEQRLLSLTEKLVKDNRTVELSNISTNDALRNTLYVEYGL